MTSESDDDKFIAWAKKKVGIYLTDKDEDRLFALARRGAAVQWRPIEEAPKDGTWFIAYSQDLSGNGLSPFISCCSWHPDAGFCTDEIREPTHFMPLPPPPAGEPND